MNVSISSEKSCFKVRLSKDNLAKLIAFAIEAAEAEEDGNALTGTESEKLGHDGTDSIIRPQQGMESLLLFGKPAGTDGREEEAAAPTGEYRGFLRIRCQWCNAVHSFCAKEPVSECRCRECDEKTKLENLKKMFVECKCGGRYKYYTNEEEPKITHNCLNCGAPVDLELNLRKSAYATIRARARRHQA